MKKSKKKYTGFTLVELVITIAIVIVLSLVSVPIYRNYVDKAKWSECYALFGVILSAQKTYYSEYGMFLHDDFSSGGQNNFVCKEDVLGIDARSNKYFTSFNVGYGWNGSHKHFFKAYIRKPDDLCSYTNRPYIRMHYDITERPYFEDNQGLDA